MRKLKSKFELMIALTIVLTFSVCDEGEENTRYQAIEIPGYEAKDYLKLLDSENNEVIYNSVCNLVEEATVAAKFLSNDTIDKNTSKYLLAKEMYEKISGLLYSNDEWVIGSSIRFMNDFGESYQNKNEVVSKLLKITRSSRNIQFEIVRALTALYDTNSVVETKHIEDLYLSESWLVSRASYNLINKSENIKLRHKLIEKYNSTDKEYEKLLILSALRNNYDKKTFELLTREIKTNDNKKIRTYIFKMLGKAKNKELVLVWIDKHYSELTELDVVEIAKNNYSDISTIYGSSLFVILINNGFNPKLNNSKSDGKEIPQLFYSLYENLKIFNSFQEKMESDTSSEVDIQEKEKFKKMFESLRTLENTILSHDNLKDDWLAFKKKKTTPKFPPEFIDKYKENISSFTESLESLFEEYEVDKKHYVSYTNKLNNIDTEVFKKN